MNDTEDIGGFCAKEVLPCLRAVVRPAENGGKRKKEHGDRYKFLTDIAPREYRVERTSDKGRIGVARGDLAGNDVEYAALKTASGEDNESCHGADDHSIGEHLKYTPHALLDGLFNVGVGMNHDRRAESCLVREHAALEALRYDLTYNGSDTAANERFGLERANENRPESGENV